MCIAAVFDHPNMAKINNINDALVGGFNPLETY